MIEIVAKKNTGILKYSSRSFRLDGGKSSGVYALKLCIYVGMKRKESWKRKNGFWWFWLMVIDE